MTPYRHPARPWLLPRELTAFEAYLMEGRLWVAIAKVGVATVLSFLPLFAIAPPMGKWGCIVGAVVCVLAKPGARAVERMWIG